MLDREHWLALHLAQSIGTGRYSNFEVVHENDEKSQGFPILSLAVPLLKGRLLKVYY